MYILIYETKIDRVKCMTDTSVYDCYVKFSSNVIYIIVNKHTFECLLYGTGES